jgi:hypothetical protein
MTVFYDRDDDGKLDTNFIGMPKEPIALSNNAKAKYGPPKFADAACQLGGGSCAASDRYGRVVGLICSATRATLQRACVPKKVAEKGNMPQSLTV